MKKALMAAVLAVTAANAASAAEYGMGVSAKSDDAWIYFPIDITSRIRLEPSIRFSTTKYTSTAISTDFSVTETKYRSKSDQQEIALGVFGLTALTDSTRLYYGVRAAYIDAETKSTTTFTSASFIESDEDRLSQDGYRISPTLGFEYLINKRFSIGGEASWYYLDVDSDSKNSGPFVQPEVSYEQKSNGTNTQLIVRYRF